MNTRFHVAGMWDPISIHRCKERLMRGASTRLTGSIHARDTVGTLWSAQVYLSVPVLHNVGYVLVSGHERSDYAK